MAKTLDELRKEHEEALAQIPALKKAREEFLHKNRRVFERERAMADEITRLAMVCHETRDEINARVEAAKA